MKYSQATFGRVFIVRLEDGDIIHESIERLARKESIQAGTLVVVGGADKGSTFVVGPQDGRSQTIVPMEHTLENVHEVAGTGTLFPDEEGNPIVHMHMACGRNTDTITGCIRTGVKVWQVMEVILFELLNTTGKRQQDPITGFKLLIP